MVRTMISKHTTDQAAAHHPTTVAEIRQTRRALFERERALREEGAAAYRATQAGSPPSRPMSDHQLRVAGHIQHLMNGATPPSVLVPAVSRDQQISAEIAAIAYVDRNLGQQEETLLERDAAQYALEIDGAWRALCREIVLAAVKLASLEQRARDMLEPIQWPVTLAMGSTIGSGLSLLGDGDPLREMRADALKHGIVKNSDIQKVEQQC
jgi:hypothetical protein